MTDTSGNNVRPWRYTRLGSVLLSYDFYLGVPLGLGAAVAVGLSSDLRAAAPGLLMGTAAVSAAIATLVLTSLTVLLTTVSTEYRRLLRRTPSGITGIAAPYRLVVKIGSIGALASIMAAFAISIPGGLSLGTFQVGSAAAVFPGLALTAWATLGCIQLTEQFIRHWKQNDQAMEIEERRKRATSRSAS